LAPEAEKIFMLKTLAQYESAKILRESDFLFISEGEKEYL